MLELFRRYGYALVLGACGLFCAGLLLQRCYQRPPDSVLATDLRAWGMAMNRDGTQLAVERGPSVGIRFIDALGSRTTSDAGQATVLRQVPDGVVLHTLPVSGTRGLAFDPTGTWLAILSVTGELSVWSVADGHRLTTVRHQLPTNYGRLAFTPDSTGITLFDGAQTSVYAWRSGTVVQTYPGCATFAPDGGVVAVNRRMPRAQTELRRVADGAVLHTVGIDGCAQFTRGGTQLFGPAADNQSAAHVVDVGSGRTLRTFRGTGNWHLAATDPAGRWVALGQQRNTPGGFLNLFPDQHRTYGAIAVWDLATGWQVATLAGSPEGTEALAWSADGRWLAASGADPASGIRLWDMSRRGWLGWW